MRLLAQTGNIPLDILLVWGGLVLGGVLIGLILRFCLPSVVFAVFKRNLVSFFSNPIGYLFITAFTAVGAYFAFWHENKFFADNICDLTQLNTYFPMLALLFVPAITMSIWAEERKTGTEELLLTLPGSDLQIVLGKYLAALAVYTVSLAFLSSLYFVLVWLGQPDPGLIACTFLGYWFLGGALLAAGMVASALTSNVTVAFILGAVFCAFLVIPNTLAAGIGNAAGIKSATTSFFGESVFTRAIGQLIDGLERVGVVDHFEPFSRGQIQPSDVVYFISITAVLLYVNVVLLSRRHWAGGPSSASRWMNYIVRSASLIIIAVALTTTASAFSSRLAIDATAERLHTMSPIAGQILEDKDVVSRTVRIEAFLSPDPPKDYVEIRRNLIDALERIQQLSGGKVVVEIHNTLPSSDEARRAERLYQIRPRMIRLQQDGSITERPLFLGVAMRSGLNEKTIPFFSQTVPVEYELVRTIRKVASDTPTKIGILTTGANVMGSDPMGSPEMMMMGMGGMPPWSIVELLGQQYEVVKIDPEKDEGWDQIKVLIAPMPSLLQDAPPTPPAEGQEAKPSSMDRLIKYIQSGGPTLILEDPFSLYMAMTDQRYNPQPFNPGLMKLTSALGISYNSGAVVGQAWNPIRQYDIGPEYVFVARGNGNPLAFNPDDPTTKDLQQILMIAPGAISSAGSSSGLEMTSLLETGTLSGTMAPSALMSRMPRRLQGPQIARTLAALIQSKPKEDETPENEKGVNVIFVADLDMMSDLFRQLELELPEGRLRFDNLSFLLNAVDVLAGDTELLALRNKRPQRRTLDQIEEILEASEQKVLDEKANAEAKTQELIDEANKSLKEIQSKIDETKSDANPSVLFRLKVEEAREVQKAEIRAQEIRDRQQERIRDIEQEATRDRRAQERRVQYAALLLPPIPALLMGIIVFFWRRSGETVGAEQSRLRA